MGVRKENDLEEKEKLNIQGDGDREEIYPAVMETALFPLSGYCLALLFRLCRRTGAAQGSKSDSGRR